MKDTLKRFEYLSDATDELDTLIELASKTRKHSEKQRLLTAAQELADAYQEHCSAGGNDKKQFNTII